MNDRFKRPFDLTVTVAALLLLSPFWLVLGVAIALAIRIEDRTGPVRIVKFGGPAGRAGDGGGTAAAAVPSRRAAAGR